jgi:hypothetical protein
MCLFACVRYSQLFSIRHVLLKVAGSRMQPSQRGVPFVHGCAPQLLAPPLVRNCATRLHRQDYEMRFVINLWDLPRVEAG